MLWILAIIAAILLSLAAYAQARIPAHTTGRVQVALTRVVLALVGVLFGYVVSTNVVDERAPPLLVFLVGFGAVHFPAALILFFKGQRGDGKS